jgi:hypothetical protein
MRVFRHIFPIVVFALFITCPLSAYGPTPNASIDPISKNGRRLLTFLDALDVEHHWLPKRHVNWMSGEPINDGTARGVTHCSAFVASVCARLGVYILRQPDHLETGLANAQCFWLEAYSKDKGWTSVKTPTEAQNRANQGEIVVVTFPDPQEKPGHIAIVKPSQKSQVLIQNEGAQIIQSGQRNFESISLREGFALHRGVWISSDRYNVKFYAHQIETWPHP